MASATVTFIMKKLFLVLLLTGCATAKTNPHNVTLDALMRSAYHIGCGEKALRDMIKIKDSEVKAALKDCQDHAKEFDLNQTGIYNDKLRLEK